jgi:hypothetical protein
MPIRHHQLRNKHTENRSNSTKSVESNLDTELNVTLSKITNSNIEQKKTQIHIYADSHGKNLGKLLEALLPRQTGSFVYASSGGTTCHVLERAGKEISNFSEDDTVVVIVGANDICDTTRDNQGYQWKLLMLLKSFHQTIATQMLLSLLSSIDMTYLGTVK